ncbi:MAG: type II 3-dehydroquinate dehydratase, partial [Alphaproteobacteria bacterium]
MPVPVERNSTILILNGPNLNLLGRREPEIYGATTLDEIAERCDRRAAGHGLTVIFRQSNSEAELIGWIQGAADEAAALIINAGALTHTSLALGDALRAAGVPAIEVHLSNIYAREPFRHHSWLSAAAVGVVCGFGALSYDMAIDAAADRLS